MKDAITYKVLEYAIIEKNITISMVQRYCRLGYPSAARAIDDLEDAGLLVKSPVDKRRRIIVDNFDCYWCKEYAGLDESEYRYEIKSLGGFDIEGELICDGCYDSADTNDEQPTPPTPRG